MAQDRNVRTLPQVLAIAKAIIDAGREQEFLKACEGRDDLFVVSTESARDLIASFLNQHGVSPQGVLRNFSYGNSRC